jgi:hypothetical protein
MLGRVIERGSKRPSSLSKNYANLPVLLSLSGPAREKPLTGVFFRAKGRRPGALQPFSTLLMRRVCRLS